MNAISENPSPRLDPPSEAIERLAWSAPVRAVVGAVILVHDLIVWAGGPIWRALSRLEILARLSETVRGLPRWAVLVALALPLAIAEPLKLGGLFVMATGHVGLGVALQIVGHALSIVLVERILHAGRPQLMSYRWFAWAWSYFEAIRARVLAWPAVVAARLTATRYARQAREGLARARHWARGLRGA